MAGFGRKMTAGHRGRRTRCRPPAGRARRAGRRTGEEKGREEKGREEKGREEKGRRKGEKKRGGRRKGDILLFSCRLRCDAVNCRHATHRTRLPGRLLLSRHQPRQWPG